MPLFGGKKDQDKKKKEAEAVAASSSGYPTQAPPPYNPTYPTQAAPQATPQGYPQAQAAPPTYTQQQPPPYQGQPVAGQYGAPGQAGALPPNMYYTQGMPPTYAPVQQTVSVAGAYDAGARFDGVAQRNIPPPPPGVMPNAAQVAQAQGHHVVGTQQHAGWFEGASGGGYTIW